MTGEIDPATLSVIVVSYNTKHLLDEMMTTLRVATTGLPLQVIMVDNASQDGSAEYIRRSWPEVHLIANHTNVGFGRANNQALSLVRGVNILLLNTDAFVSPDSVRVGLQQLREHPRCGIVGMRLVGRDGAIQPSCRYFPTPWNILLWRTGLFKLFPGTRLVDDPLWNDRLPAECDWVPGAFLLTRREVVQQVGLFDPRYFLYYEEVDFCRAAKLAAWTVHYCPDSDVVHVGGESAKSEGKLSQGGRQLSVLQIESELLYFRKHYGVAGLIASVALALTGDAFLGLKRIARPRRGPDSTAFITPATLRILRRTRFATRPTR